MWRGILKQIHTHTHTLMGFLSDSAVKNPPANARDEDWIPGSGRSPGEGNGNLLQYSCLEIPCTEKPGGLQSMESQRVGNDLATKLSNYIYIQVYVFILECIYHLSLLKRLQSSTEHTNTNHLHLILH